MENVSEARPDETVSEIPQSRAIALPKTVAALMEQKKSKQTSTLNDQVETVHLSLWEKPEYQRFLDAVYKEQAIEGDLFCDDIEASRLIRDEARKQGNAYVSGQKLATIRKALMVVLRRYRISRTERRDD